MRVLVVGTGGREHAIAWACERHGHTVRIGPELGSVTAADVDLVIPGPETMLAAGIADECAFRRIPCFGPSSKQARIESSKGFSRDLAASLGVPGPQYARFEQLDDGHHWRLQRERPMKQQDRASCPTAPISMAGSCISSGRHFYSNGSNDNEQAC